MNRFCRYSNWAYRVIPIYVLAGFVSIVYGQPPSNLQTLSINQPVESTIRGGETKSFQFNITAGQYTRVEVEQKNIDVVVSLFALDGKLVVEMDGIQGRLWRECPAAISKPDGAFRRAQISLLTGENPDKTDTSDSRRAEIAADDTGGVNLPLFVKDNKNIRPPALLGLVRTDWELALKLFLTWAMKDE